MSWAQLTVSQNIHSPRTVDEISTNKFDDIHFQLYENAINLAVVANIGKYFSVVKGKPEFDDNVVKCIIDDDKWKFVNSLDGIDDDKCGYIDLNEWIIREDDRDVYIFFAPTKAVFISKKFMNKNSLIFTKFTLDLEPYWINEYNIKVMMKHKLITPIDWIYPHSDIIEYDYVNGTATLENRVENKRFKINFKNISYTDRIKIQKIF